jgi:ribonuclease/clavin/mitogillin
VPLVDFSPDVTEVAEGVARIALRTPTLPPATHTNCYLLGTTDFFVVEPASPWEPEQSVLRGVIEVRRAAGHRLLGVLVTHHHGDHVGGVDDLRRRYGAPLVAHAATRDKLKGRLSVDRVIAPGAALDAALGDVEVLHTPGHAPGHLCLRSPRGGWSLVGDMVASVGTILIDPDDDGDMDAYLASLASLAAGAPGRLLPAHGDPIDDGEARLRAYVAHRLAREARVADAVEAGATSLVDVVARAYDDVPRSIWVLASKSARAHLARLVGLGRVRATGAGWVRADGPYS